jgi:predicted DNA-binding antitoxin AbrB/MazE fold protein
MTTRFEAVYEHGILRPTEPVSLEEGAKVEVIVVQPAIGSSGCKAAEILCEIAAMPMEPGGREFTGRDHDKILYGGRGER